MNNCNKTEVFDILWHDPAYCLTWHVLNTTFLMLLFCWQRWYTKIIIFGMTRAQHYVAHDTSDVNTLYIYFWNYEINRKMGGKAINFLYCIHFINFSPFKYLMKQFDKREVLVKYFFCRFITANKQIYKIYMIEHTLHISWHVV
jgi:hypothetical protein